MQRIFCAKQRVKYAAIDEHAGEYPIRWMCRILSVSPSGFYAWRVKQQKPCVDKRTLLLTHIRAVHAEGRKTYGSPRVHARLRAAGIRVSQRRVARLMRENGIVGRQKRLFVKTTVRNDATPPAENILVRNFFSIERNRKWVTDITYIRTDDGWLYLAAIIDLYSRRVVGYAMAEHMRVELALDALRNAVKCRDPKPGLLHHSDQGCQYTSLAYQAELASLGMISSMSRKGECWDNSVAESFFGRLKEELIHYRKWGSFSEVRRAVEDYIDTFYNTRRVQKELGYLSPNEYELQAASQNLAA